MNRKTSRGGYLRRITDDKIVQYRKTDDQPKNCCPCVMKFFGENPDVVNTVFTVYGQYGMEPEAIENAFKHVYPNYNFKFNSLDNIVTEFDVRTQLKKIYDTVERGYGLFAGYRRRNCDHHCISFAKDLSDNIYLLDAQTGQIFMNEEIVKHLYTGVPEHVRVNKLFYLFGYDRNGNVLKIDV